MVSITLPPASVLKLMPGAYAPDEKGTTRQISLPAAVAAARAREPQGHGAHAVRRCASL